MKTKKTSTTKVRRKAGIKANVDLEQLLETACLLISKKGFHETSFQSIADRAKISQTTVMHYFKNKNTLVRLLIGHVVQSNRNTVEPLFKTEDTPVDRLKKHFLGNFRWGERYPHQISVLLLFYYMGSVNEDFSELYTEVRKRARMRIQEILEKIPASKKTSNKNFTAEWMAEMLHDLLVGAGVNAVATQSMEGSEDALLQKLESILKAHGWLSA